MTSRISPESEPDEHLRGNFSVRSLADVVSKEDFIEDSEYLETLLVAVPR
jgi:hypothetical protein